MQLPDSAINEYEAIFLQPRTAVQIIGLCATTLFVARQLLDEEDPSRQTQQALLHLDAALHHLQKAQTVLPRVPEATL